MASAERRGTRTVGKGPRASRPPASALRAVLRADDPGSTHEAHAAIRITPQVMAIGQAAGTAAAFCVKNNLNSTRDLDPALLRETLREQGAFVRRTRTATEADLFSAFQSFYVSPPPPIPPKWGSKRPCQGSRNGVPLRVLNASR